MAALVACRAASAFLQLTSPAILGLESKTGYWCDEKCMGLLVPSVVGDPAGHQLSCNWKWAWLCGCHKLPSSVDSEGLLPYNLTACINLRLLGSRKRRLLEQMV